MTAAVAATMHAGLFEVVRLGVDFNVLVVFPGHHLVRLGAKRCLLRQRHATNTESDAHSQ